MPNARQTQSVEETLVWRYQNKISQSSLFCNSHRLKRFIEFTVRETLAGKPVKEYSIGVAVFDKGEEFDPRVDPVVRVQARRLRRILSKYYDTLGAEDPIRIIYQPGGYAPTFVEANSVVEENQQTLKPSSTLKFGNTALDSIALRT